MIYRYIVLLFLGLFSQCTYTKQSKKHAKKVTLQKEQKQINNLLEHLSPSVPLVILDRHPHPVEKIKWSPDNVHIATYAGDNLVRIWNTQTGALIDGIGSAVEIKDFAWAPDAERIAITHHTNQAWVCDLIKVYELEKAVQLLSAEQLAFMDLFIADKPLKKLDEKQQEIFETLPDVVKDSLNVQLKFNIEENQRNPLREN